MATPTTQYRYVTSYGILSGSTDNTGYNYDITPIKFTTAQGTSSMFGTFSVYPMKNHTFVNLETVPSGTGTAQIVINATYSQIFDECTILAVGAASGTYSVVLSGNAVAVTSLTVNIPATKSLKLSGVYNGTNFIFGSSLSA